MKLNNYIKIFIFILGFFVATPVFAADLWVTDLADCGSSYMSQTCSGDTPYVCGYNGTTFCAAGSLVAPAANRTESSTTISGSGGFKINCYATPDAASPYCDNGGNFTCTQSSTCNTLKQTTVCTANSWGVANCGDCKTGYHDCDGNSANGCSGSTEHDGDSCTTGGLPGTYSNCVCVATAGTLKLSYDSSINTTYLKNSIFAVPSMSIFSSGNIGINTTTASTKLSIDGGTNNVLNVNGGRIMGLNDTPVNDDEAVPLSYLLDNYTSTATSTLNSLWSGTKDGNIWNGTSGTGNVGIGTSNPIKELEVNGTILINNTTGSDTLFFGDNFNWFQNYGTGLELRSTTLPISFHSVSNVLFNAGRSGTSGAINFNTDTITRLQIDFDGNFNVNSGQMYIQESSGKVGIGTSNPTQKFVVSDNTDPRVSVLDNDAGGSASTNAGILFGRRSSAPVIYGELRFDTNNLYLSHQTSTGGLFLQTNSATAMAITNLGNVGIGTTEPLSILHIDGGVGSMSTGLVFGDGDTGFYENSDDSLYLRTGGNLSFLFNSSSNQSRTFIPFSSGYYNLGQESRKWKTLYTNTIIDDGSNVAIGATAATTTAKLFADAGTGNAIHVNGGRIIGLNDVPINDSEAVSYEYLMSIINALPSGTAKYATATPVVYNGSQGGYTSANDLCDAVSFGSHVCTAEEILQGVNNGDNDNFPPDTSLWINSGPPGYTANANDCFGWNSNDSSYYGTVWIRRATGDGFGALVTCNESRAYACCK